MNVEGDAQFPAIDPDVWHESARNEHQPAAEDEAAFAFVTYERASPGPPVAGGHAGAQLRTRR
jgi:hypothetical protein